MTKSTDTIQKPIPAGEAVEDISSPSQTQRKLSDERMSDLIKKFTKQPNERNLEKEKVGAKSEGEAPKADSSEPTPVEPEKPAEKLVEKPAEVKPEQTPTGKINWEQEYKKHQSRADKLHQELTQLKTQFDEKEEEMTRLRDYEKVIQAFEKNPVNFINEYLPDVAKQLTMYGDPVLFIESKTKEFRKELDKKFKETYGEDWKFSDREAYEPGTPSFRYRIALDDALANLRDEQRSHVTQEKTRIENRQKRVSEDKERLKADFGFTDEDLTKVDEFAKNNELSYYLIGQIALMDKIVEQKLSAIAPPPTPPPDATDVSGSHAGEDGTQKLSKEAKKLVSRIGPRAWQR